MTYDDPWAEGPAGGLAQHEHPAEFTAERSAALRELTHRWVREDADRTRARQDALAQVTGVTHAVRPPWLPDPAEPREQLTKLLTRWSEEYTDAQVWSVDQYDGWIDVEPGDALITPDEDGDCLMGGSDRAISRSMGGGGGLCVRVHILTGTPPVDAARLLRKMADWVERRPVLGSAPDEPPF